MDYLLPTLVEHTLIEVCRKVPSLRNVIAGYKEDAAKVSDEMLRAGSFGAVLWQVADSISTTRPRTTMKKPKLFLSYSRADIAKVRRIEEQLQKGGFETWRDDKSIVVGDPILDRIRQCISEETDFTLVFISRNSVNSQWCKTELRLAYSREMKAGDPIVLPVLIDNCEIPQELTIKKYIDLRRATRSRIQELQRNIYLLYEAKQI